MRLECEEIRKTIQTEKIHRSYMWSAALGQGKPDIFTPTGFAKTQLREFDGKARATPKWRQLYDSFSGDEKSSHSPDLRDLDRG